MHRITDASGEVVCVSARPPDSFSYHDVTACDSRGRVTRVSWTVIAEWLDQSGDIEEVESVADFRTEVAAERHCEKLNRALAGVSP